MFKPRQKTEIKHSESKDAWNVVGTKLGGKYKIARIPYVVVEDNQILTLKIKEADADATKILNDNLWDLA